MIKCNSLKRAATAIAILSAVALPAIAGGVNVEAQSVGDPVSAAYFDADYKYLNDGQSVFQTLTYEEAVYLFEREGNYLILLGGSWCPNTTAIIDYVNYAAKAAGVDTVYNLDFRLDGTNSDTHIRESNGGKATGAQYNYLYGELVSRYLTNLDDWVEYSSDRATALDYTNAAGEEVTVAKVQVPFLFIYNKDNTVHNYEDKNDDRAVKTKPAEKDEEGNLKKYPIVYGFERMVYRKSGTDELYTSSGTQDESTRVDNYAELLDGAIFSHIGNAEGALKLSNFTLSDYFRLAYANRLGNAERINIVTLTYRQLEWLLGQDGKYLILFGGAKDTKTQSEIARINDLAVKNNVTVYNFDYRLDGGAAVNWGYAKELNIKDGGNAFAGLYARLVDTYLKNGDLTFFAYDKSAPAPAAAGDYEELFASFSADDREETGYVSRIIALAVGIAVIAAALLYAAFKPQKPAKEIPAPQNDGCGGCEQELPQESSLEHTEEAGCGCGVNDDEVGGCCGINDDDGGGCGCC